MPDKVECAVERRQTCIHAELAASIAADAATKQVFAIFGVDIDDPKEVKIFQEGLWFGGRVHRATYKTMAYAGLLVVGLITTALAYLIWDSIVQVIHRGGK